MFKNVYLLLIGVFAMMLVGFLNVSDSESISYADLPTSDNLLIPSLTTETINGVTFTHLGDNIYSVNGTATGDAYVSLLDSNLSNTLIATLVSLSSYWSPTITNDYTWSGEMISGTAGSLYVYVYKSDDTNLGNALFNVVNAETTGNLLDSESFTLVLKIKNSQVYDNAIFSLRLESGTVASSHTTSTEVITYVNGTDDYIQSIIKASPYLVALFVIVGVTSYLMTGKKEND